MDLNWEITACVPVQPHLLLLNDFLPTPGSHMWVKLTQRHHILVNLRHRLNFLEFCLHWDACGQNQSSLTAESVIRWVVIL